MHTKIHAVLSRSHKRVDVRRRRYELMRRRRSSFLTKEHVLSTTQNYKSNHKYINQFRIIPVLYSNFRTASSSGAQPIAATISHGHDEKNETHRDFDSYDKSSLHQEIEDLTDACMTQLLPDKMFCANENVKPRRRHNSLDQELGTDTIWDSSLNKDEDNQFKLSHEIVKEQAFRENDMNDTFNGSTSSVMEMLKNFDPTKPPTSGDLEELQLWLECFSQRETVLRHQELVRKARDRKAFDSMSLMQRHVVQWFQGLRDAIDIRQKEFLSNEDKRRASNRYGPFLCSLHPDKMAVILSQEAITQALLNGGKDGKGGIALVKMARAIGTAVETEVVSQRRIKERYYDYLSNKPSDDKLVDKEENNVDDDSSGSVERSIEKTEEYSIDRWTLSASHLKFFFDDLKRMGMGKSKRSIQYAMKRAKQAMKSGETWTSDDLTHLGAALLSILTEHAMVNENGREEPAFRVEKRWSQNYNKSTSFITIHDRLHKIFLEDDYLSWAANTTRHMPMIVPPSKWIAPNAGGYRWLEVEMMRTHRSNVQKEVLQHADLSIVYDGLNILGKTAWKINKDILEIGENCWENNIPIGDIPSRIDFEVPSEPIYPTSFNPEPYTNKEDPELKSQINAFQSYRASTTKRQRILQKNMDLRSLRCSAMLKINQANKFKEFERIYFPYNLDFRGRAYPVPPHLSNVGSDLCRGMLTFSEEKPLGKRGLYWLKVHLANFAGKDKMSFGDRANYIDENMQNIRESVESPFSGNKWWMKLDDPFQGLVSFCMHAFALRLDSTRPKNTLLPSG